jgi:hypothetical protein
MPLTIMMVAGGRDVAVEEVAVLAAPEGCGVDEEVANGVAHVAYRESQT